MFTSGEFTPDSVGGELAVGIDCRFDLYSGYFRIDFDDITVDAASAPAVSCSALSTSTSTSRSFSTPKIARVEMQKLIWNRYFRLE